MHQADVGCPRRPRARFPMSRCPVVSNEPGHGFCPYRDNRTSIGHYRDGCRDNRTFSNLPGHHQSTAQDGGDTGALLAAGSIALGCASAALCQRDNTSPAGSGTWGGTSVPLVGTSRTLSFIAVAFMAWSCLPSAGLELWPVYSL